MSPSSSSISSLREALWEAPSGLEWCHLWTEAVDSLVREVVVQEGAEIRLALVATGGYGRRELAPFSDLDLVLIPDQREASELESDVRRVHRALQDEVRLRLGLTIGYSYLPPQEASAVDEKTRTGLMDGRLLVGPAELWEELRDGLASSLERSEFLVSKFDERRNQRARYSRGAVEPQLRDGPGGLRDRQFWSWIDRTLGGETPPSSPSYEVLLTARNLVHAAAGRKQDLLTRARQAEIADRLEVEMFAWTQKVAEASEEERAHFDRRMAHFGNETRFTFAPAIEFESRTVRIGAEAKIADAAAGILCGARLGFDAVKMDHVPSDPGEGRRLLQLLTAFPEEFDRLMDSGLIDALLPDLRSCRSLFPRDAAHSYTVHEHTRRTATGLLALQSDSGFLGELYRSIEEKDLLLLAVLLHDVGKIAISRPHSEVGAEIALQQALRLGYPLRLAREVQWLVAEHLSMARTMRMRDLHDPQTIEEFAELVGNVSRLGRLALLTAVDIMAVSGEAWTPALAEFHQELYEKARDYLDPETVVAPRNTAAIRQAIHRAARASASNPPELDRFLESLPGHYALTVSPELVAVHLALVAQTREQGAVAVADLTPAAQATEITFCAPDAPGLLSRALGVLYAYDLSLLSIKAHTTQETEAIALDRFVVAFQGHVVPPSTLQRVLDGLRQVALDAEACDRILERQGKDPHRRQEILNWTYQAGHPGILEVRAPRGKGMAYRMSRWISQQGWNIVSARVGQWAGQGAAAFYISGAGGAVLTSDQIQSAMTAQV